MEIILTQKVKNLGSAGEQVKVAQGYAENYLIPKKIGVRATVANKKFWENQASKINKIESTKQDQAQAVADKLSKITVSVIKKAGAEGKLFGSVTSKEISSALKEQSGVEIDKKNLILSDSLKSIGSFQIKVSLHPEVEGTFALDITASEESSE